MKNLEELTVIIVTFNTSEEVILDCLKSIDKNVKILIIENSKKFFHQKLVQSKFDNVEIICTGENLGYGKGNNFGIKHAKSNYVLILNPDVICEKNFFSNIPSVINEAKDFTIIGCQYIFDKIFMPAGFFNNKKNSEFRKNFNNKINQLAKVDWVTGCAMILNLKKFNDNEVFDKNFFLYFEEIDLCKSIIKKGENIYSSQKLKINHLGFKSSVDKKTSNKEVLNKVREWHWMWSSFYFYKKNFGYYYAFYKMFGKLIKSLIKLIFYSLVLKKNKRDKYLYRFLGIMNSLLGQPSFFRDKDN